MHELSIPKLIMKRLLDDWKLLLSVFIGILIVVTVATATPLYLKALEQLAFRVTLNRITNPFLTFSIYPPRMALDAESLDQAEDVVSAAAERHLEEIYAGHETFFRTSGVIAGIPDRPLPDAVQQGANATVGYGLIEYLSGLDQNARFIDGRMSTEAVEQGPRGPIIEGVVSFPTADEYKFKAGDVVTLAPDLATETRVSIRITGVIEPNDALSPFWTDAGAFYFSTVPDPVPAAPEGTRFDTDKDIAVAVYVSRNAMTEVWGKAYPGSLASPILFSKIDKGLVSSWPIAKVEARLAAFQTEINKEMTGAQVNTGIITGTISDVNRRSLFSRVPLMLLVAVMIVTVLFYLSMMMSYLIQSRERDAALLRTRGVGLLQLLRLYVLEGLVMVGVAVIAAPFLSTVIVALAGKTPYFSETTGGGFLPVQLNGAPFMAAGLIGLACLAIFALYGAMGTRSGILVQKLRAARPATMSFFHRYYLDFALMGLGGIVFWELRSRGQLVSGGLFSDVQINETLLFAPVLFLVVVALFFMRVFPLLVRYVAGESRGLVHLLVAVTTVPVIAVLLTRGWQDRLAMDEWLTAPAMALGVAVAYWLTSRGEGTMKQGIGMVVQAAFTAAFLSFHEIDTTDNLFQAIVGMVAVVPAQLLFMAFRQISKATPVWLTMAIWRMARNPLQYTWLVLLLVLATGLAVLSTTVGGTLARSQEERILFDVPTDMRLRGNPYLIRGGLKAIDEQYTATSAITESALAFRTTGSAGPSSVQILGVETDKFADIAWFRDDFSEDTLPGLMTSLQPHTSPSRIALPEGATEVGVWVKPAALHVQISVWMVLQDAKGVTRTVSLGDLGQPQWHIVRGQVPESLQAPIHILGVELYEPGWDVGSMTAGSNTGSVGTVLMDDIVAFVGEGGEGQVLESFEGGLRWSPMATSVTDRDAIAISNAEAVSGLYSLKFDFGRYKNRGVRGFYQLPGDQNVPILVNTGLAGSNGLRPGDRFTAVVAGTLVPVEVREIVDFFPTVDPGQGHFVVADMGQLLSYLNLMSHLGNTDPNELFVSTAGHDEVAMRQMLADFVKGMVNYQSGSERLQAVRLDPLTSSGWKAMVLVALGIVLMAATFGYVSYLLLVAGKSKHEVGFLKSMGLSRLQLGALVGFEHMAIVGMGLGLGTWAGFQMSRMMVSPLAVTDQGQTVVPPFVMITDWGLMAPTYIAIVALFVAALVVLNRTIGRVDMHAIARAGDS
ncbi:MAG: hydroxyisourate hydrolase [SAR202 cluster bacterium]|nr:hydroxyisourate hydrolase [SAR202 cluster bacterium]